MLHVAHINRDLERTEERGKELAKKIRERRTKNAHKMLMQQGLNKTKTNQR